MDQLNGIYPDTSETDPTESRGITSVPPATEAERFRLCQYSEDLTHAVPHLQDLHDVGTITCEDLMTLMNACTDAAAEAVRACLEGYLSINPATASAMLFYSLAWILKDETRPLHDTINKVVSLMIDLRGPDAARELIASGVLVDTTDDSDALADALRTLKPLVIH